MTDSDQPGPAFSDIEAARLLLGKMGISPADLLRSLPPAPVSPAFADYIPLSPKPSAPEPAGSTALTGTGYSRHGDRDLLQRSLRWKSASSPSRSRQAWYRGGTPGAGAAQPST